MPRGQGVLFAGGETALRGNLLLNVPPGVLLRVRATKGTPLALLAFRPEA